jgi:signal transduction histidine kinase/HAMP domain-containing protein
MRFWLPLAFAAIAAVTAVIVSWVFSARSENALRGSAEDFAVASTIGASESVASALQHGTNLSATLEAITARRRLAIFVFDEHRKLISPNHSRQIQLRFIAPRDVAVRAALGRGRYISTIDHGNGTLVALPIPRAGGAVLTYSPRPELEGQLGIVHRQIVQAALFASLAGALAGLLVAMLIAARLRRIATAANAIEGGSFDTRLHPWLKDELGALAETIDRMRIRLRDTFGRLESERDRLRRLLERLHDGVIAVDEDLRVEFGNTAARRLMRAPLADGDELPEPWGEASLRELARDLFRSGSGVRQDTISTRAGRVYTVVGIPPRGRSKTAVLVLTDVSERERRERAEREFVTNAAHELRSPLATITGAIQVLQAGAKDEPEERERFLGHIEREAARLGRLTHSLLVLARAQTQEEAPNLAPLELKPLLETIAAYAQPPAQVTVEVSCPAGLEVLAERDLVEQAVSNLTANALQNTERGRIEIVARPLPGGSVVLEVTDTGQGIAPERQERIFDRFYRPDGRDPRRFGLGLAIVRQAVTALGGRLEVESAVGSGTTVRITLAGAHTEAA